MDKIQKDIVVRVTRDNIIENYINSFVSKYPDAKTTKSSSWTLDQKIHAIILVDEILKLYK